MDPEVLMELLLYLGFWLEQLLFLLLFLSRQILILLFSVMQFSMSED